MNHRVILLVTGSRSLSQRLLTALHTNPSRKWRILAEDHELAQLRVPIDIKKGHDLGVTLRQLIRALSRARVWLSRSAASGSPATL